MALTNAAETDILKLLFTNVAWAGIGDGSGLQPSAVAGSFYIAIFTSDPTDTGSAANECAYTSYTRTAVARTTGEWTVTNDEVVNDNLIQFVAATGGSETATHWAICKAGTPGVADILWHGALTSGLAISNGIQPQIGAGVISVTSN